MTGTAHRPAGPRPWPLGPRVTDLLIGGATTLAFLLVALVDPTSRDALSHASPPGIAWIAAGIPLTMLRGQAPWIAVTAAHLYWLTALLPPVGIDGYDYYGPLAVVAFTTACHLGFQAATAVAALLWGPVLTVWLTREGLDNTDHLTRAVLIAVLIYSAGRTIYARRAATQAQAERAEAAQAHQRALATQAAAEERRRVARELHDLVAHHISVMSVLSSGARRTLTRDPAAADQALAGIEDTGRTVLREMRRLLDVLRTDDPTADDNYTPQPGLAALTDLADRIRAQGLPVDLRCTTPTIDDFGPGLALTVYRIVEEGLTNALKHAGPATATVTLARAGGTLTIEIADDGRGPRPDAPNPDIRGHGIIGMRERVAVFGGTLRVGPRPGGGYRLIATLPLDTPGYPTGSTPARLTP